MNNKTKIFYDICSMVCQIHLMSGDEWSLILNKICVFSIFSAFLDFTKIFKSIAGIGA